MMQGPRTTWCTALFQTTKNQQYRQSPRSSRAKTLSFISLIIALSRGESLRPPAYEQVIAKTSGRSREHLTDAYGSAHTKITETRRNATGGTQRCDHKRRHVRRRRDHATAAVLHTSSTASERGPCQPSHVQHHSLFEHGLCTLSAAIVAACTSSFSTNTRSTGSSLSEARSP